MGNLQWLACYDHRAIRLELPAGVDISYEQKTFARKWDHANWESSLQKVLQWAWTKHELMQGEPRPPTAYITDDIRAAVGQWMQALPQDMRRTRHRALYEQSSAVERSPPVQQCRSVNARPISHHEVQYCMKCSVGLIIGAAVHAAPFASQ